MTYVITVVLIAFSALFSGLTLGLMGLDVFELKRKMKLGDKNAKKIFPIREKGNLLLTTLLLGNVGINSALAIFLGSIASGVTAGLIATGLIFMFGEIIPQAVISRHALKFGAKVAWLVRIIIIVLYPITAPIAYVLDKALGKEMQTFYSKSELKSLIAEHEDSSESEIDEDEERIMMSTLTFAEKIASEVMTPKTVIDTVVITDDMTPGLINRLRDSGHSRFPVYDKDKSGIVGLLYLRDLVGVSFEGKTASDFVKKEFRTVQSKTRLDDAFNAFIKHRQHLFIVVDKFGTFQGVISFEDVLEEIVGQEIIDEFDKFADLRKVAEINRKKAQAKERKSKK